MSKFACCLLLVRKRYRERESLGQRERERDDETLKELKLPSHGGKQPGNHEPEAATTSASSDDSEQVWRSDEERRIRLMDGLDDRNELFPAVNLSGSGGLLLHEQQTSHSAPSQLRTATPTPGDSLVGATRRWQPENKRREGPSRQTKPSNWLGVSVTNPVGVDLGRGRCQLVRRLVTSIPTEQGGEAGVGFVSDECSRRWRQKKQFSALVICIKL